MTSGLTDHKKISNLDRSVCERARLSRDARFDGQFFTAVKTTGIYCRPICPASPPLEKNVNYYHTSIMAAQAGFRPCLRCRPDSAPQSFAWIGTKTTFERALRLIQEGELQHSSVEGLANRLGISSRYLRELFDSHIGVSPKKYAIYQQCLFAKQLLHETSVPVTQIAFASGFKSVRRFNEAMKKELNLAPKEIRKNRKPVQNTIKLKLSYRPPFAWTYLFDFLSNRTIPKLEWSSADSYSRTIRYGSAKGFFTVRNNAEQNCLLVDIDLDDFSQLNSVIQRIKLLFDVDAPIEQIDEQLQASLPEELNYLPGLRVPGIWSNFEAGVRAILGQQVSVGQARNLVTDFVEHLGEDLIVNDKIVRKLFPEPSQVCDHPLDFFRMPQARKDCLRRLAKCFAQNDMSDNIDDWLDIKGIGPWTVNYVKIRASKDPDVWLAGDAGVKNALKILDTDVDTENTKPWRSYVTLQLWNQLD